MTAQRPTDVELAELIERLAESLDNHCDGPHACTPKAYPLVRRARAAVASLREPREDCGHVCFDEDCHYFLKWRLAGVTPCQHAIPASLWEPEPQLLTKATDDIAGWAARASLRESGGEDVAAIARDYYQRGIQDAASVHGFDAECTLKRIHDAGRTPSTFTL